MKIKRAFTKLKKISEMPRNFTMTGIDQMMRFYYHSSASLKEDNIELVCRELRILTHTIEKGMMVPFSAVVMWTFGEKIGNGWKKILCNSGKIAFIFSVSIEMLQLLLRLGTFQLSDILYNTVGGVLGGLMYCAVMKVRKRL